MTLARRYRREVARAEARAGGPGPPITSGDLATLPRAVARWLEVAGAVGKSRPGSVRVRFRARIRGGPDEPWMEGTAEQHSRFDPPLRLFFMEARRAGLPVRVLHRYGGGSATMEARLLWLVPVLDVSGPELVRSETVTVLNDAFFLAPWALLDLPVEWEELGARAVRATFTHAGHTVSAVVRFDDAGRFVDFESGDRYRMDGDSAELLRWSTPMDEPADFAGWLLPSGGEARWGEPGASWAYADFRIEALDFGG